MRQRTSWHSGSSSIIKFRRRSRSSPLALLHTRRAVRIIQIQHLRSRHYQLLSGNAASTVSPAAMRAPLRFSYSPLLPPGRCCIGPRSTGTPLHRTPLQHTADTIAQLSPTRHYLHIIAIHRRRRRHFFCTITAASSSITAYFITAPSSTHTGSAHPSAHTQHHHYTTTIIIPPLCCRQLRSGRISRSPPPPPPSHSGVRRSRHARHQQPGWPRRRRRNISSCFPRRNTTFIATRHWHYRRSY